ncbi:retrovirus-related pol polyprotein from transposon TNT 1-94 [Tanacetum coccineum]
MILESVENGPHIWPTIEENGVTRPKKYFVLSATEAIQADCDFKATNIILQGLPPEYVIKSQQVVVQNSNSSAQQDALILCLIEQLKTQVVNCTKINLDTKSVNDTLTVELKRFKEQVKVLKKGQNVDLKSNDNISDTSAQSIEIDRLKQTLSEHLKEKESLMQIVSLLKNDFKKEESRNIDREIALEKRIKLLDNINSVNSLDLTPSSRPAKVEVPKELPKVSMVNTSLKKLKTILLVLTWLSKKEPRPHLLLRARGEVDSQLNQEIFQRDNSISNQSAPSFDQYFELNEMKDQSQNKYTVIKKLKEKIKSLSVKVNEDKIKKDLEEIETINIELDHRVSKLIVEDNEHLKQTNKQLSVTRLPNSYFDYNNNVMDLIISQSKTLKIDVEPITPKLLNNRTAHSAYIKHTQEEVAVIRDLVEHVKANYPLDHPLDLHDRFIEPVTSSRNTKTTSSSNLVSNKPALSSTGVKQSTSASGSQPLGNTKKDKIQRPSNSTLKNKVEAHPRICNGCMLSDNHDLCVLDFINNMNARNKSKSVKKIQREKFGNQQERITTTAKVPPRKPTALKTDTPKPVTTLVYSRKPRKSKVDVPVSKPKILKSVVQIVLWYLDSGCSKHMTGDRSQLTNFVNKFLGTVKFRNDHMAKIMGYGDYQIGNVTISRVYYVEGLGHNLFSVGQFCDSNLEVAFRQHTCFIRNLEGVDLLTGSRGNNLYTLSLGDMMASSPICLLSKASKTKSWLWHRRLSHLNFGTINHLARHGLVRGLPKLKFEKDHLCSACAMGKSKKKPHKPKSKDTNQEKLYLLHMDLYGPMRVASVNGKKYILIIVDDYSRFTWVKCLRSKDEAPDFIIKFLMMIQVRLKGPAWRIRTDNGIEFVNQTLREYYEKVGISHETSVARSPQQNEQYATGMLPQNRSIIRLRHDKTPYELLHDKLPDLSFFYVFGALCYPTNDSENLNFDELTAMASKHSSSGPALYEMTLVTISSGLVPNPPSSTPFIPPSRNDWDILFQPLFDELLTPPPSVDCPSHEVISPINEVVAPEPAASTSSPSSTMIDLDAPSLSISQTTPKTQSPIIPNDVEEDNHDLDIVHMNNDPYFGIPILEVPSDQSSSMDISHTIVHPDHQISEHNSKWTKDHPLENIIGELTRPVSTRLQLHEQALYHYNAKALPP